MGSGLCPTCLTDATTALVLQAPRGVPELPRVRAGTRRRQGGDRANPGWEQRGWGDWEKSPLSSVAATDHEMERRPSKKDPETHRTGYKSWLFLHFLKVYKLLMKLPGFSKTQLPEQGQSNSHSAGLFIGMKECIQSALHLGGPAQQEAQAHAGTCMGKRRTTKWKDKKMKERPRKTILYYAFSLSVCACTRHVCDTVRLTCPSSTMKCSLA